MEYQDFLTAVHERLQPSTYLEIGIRNGLSLSLARCRAVGIDPAYSITAEIDNNIALFRTTSDEYFSRPDPLAPTNGLPFDLSFIDGLHLFEFALRDFIHVEEHSSAKSVIVFDDVLPRSIDEAARERHTHGWTGDVYVMLEVLAQFRPELTVVPVRTRPTGLLLVFGLDPKDDTLSNHYGDIVSQYRKPDPQPVPSELLDPVSIVDPRRIIDSDFWEVLKDAPIHESPASIRAELAGLLSASIGAVFGRPQRVA